MRCGFEEQMQLVTMWGNLARWRGGRAEAWSVNGIGSRSGAEGSLPAEGKERGPGWSREGLLLKKSKEGVQAVVEAVGQCWREAVVVGGLGGRRQGWKGGMDSEILRPTEAKRAFHTTTLTLKVSRVTEPVPPPACVAPELSLL